MHTQKYHSHLHESGCGLTCSVLLRVRPSSSCRHGYGPTSSVLVRVTLASRGPATRHSGTDGCTAAPKLKDYPLG